MGNPGAGEVNSERWTMKSSYPVLKSLPTDDDQRVRERLAADAIQIDGYRVCRGYPAEHFCIVLIPQYKWPPLCHGCTRDQEADHRAIKASSPFLPSVGEILKDLPPIMIANACGCGGDADSPFHEQSLVHILWEQKQRG